MKLTWRWAAWAGPGGKIAGALAESFGGRVVLAALVVLFLPVIVWVLVKESRARRRTLAALKRLAAVSDLLDWMRARDRITDCCRGVETIWTSLVHDGAWRVANIEEGCLSLGYAGMANEIPEEHPGAALRQRI